MAERRKMLPGCRVAVLHQGCIPTYRGPFFSLLHKYSANEYVVFHGDPPTFSALEACRGPFDFPNAYVSNKEFRLGGCDLVYQPVVRRILAGDFHALVLGHEFKFLASLLVQGLFRLTGKKVILWGHGFHQKSASLLARLLSSSVVRHGCDGYLAYSAAGAEKLKRLGMDEDRVTVLRNTIDIDEQIKAHAAVLKVDSGAMRRDMGLLPDSKVLLAIGRLDERKRFDEAIMAVRRLHRAGRGVELVVVGDGPQRDRLEGLAGETPVHFLGGIHEPRGVAEIMRISAAVLIPGAVGLAINHAFAQGKPVITRDGALHGPEVEYLKPGENGLLVEGDFDRFVAVLDALLSDEPRLARLAAGALASRAELGMDYMVAQFDQGVNKVLAGAAEGGKSFAGK